jgi:tRNA(fMet)-specific endonuclease VapC
MYLLDTNHCSCLIDHRHEIASKLATLGQVQVATCVIVRGELHLMVQCSERTAENERKVKVFLQGITTHPIDNETADIYGVLKSQLLKHFGPKEKAKRRKTSVGKLGFMENDIWIASVALQRGLIVVSGDADFIRMKEAVQELQVESWIADS